MVIAEQTLELRLLKKGCSGMVANPIEICCIIRTGNQLARRGKPPFGPPYNARHRHSPHKVLQLVGPLSAARGDWNTGSVVSTGARPEPGAFRGEAQSCQTRAEGN